MREIGSEFSLSFNSDYFFKRIESFGSKVSLLRCGRDGLSTIAASIPKGSGIILFPSYCCESMYKPFEVRGWKINFYSIKSDFSSDFSLITSMISKLNPDAILLMNFFGLADNTELSMKIKHRYPKIKIVEDITHSLFDINLARLQDVDYYVGSIRKWFGITDGALLISSNADVCSVPFVENEFVRLRTLGLSLKENYIHSYDKGLKAKFRSYFSDAESTIDSCESVYGISPLSKEKLISTDFGPLKDKRKQNATFLLSLLKQNTKIRLPKNIIKVLDKTPFSIPILIDNRDFIQKELANQGIYCPLLWPLNSDSRKVCNFATELEKKMLSVPIDQRYNATDMIQMYEVLNSVLK